MSTIRRQFVRCGTRTAHCRIAGSGPALLMLHQSPQNSRQWLALIPRLARRFTVIAPDTPGFGSSEPLPLEQPTISDLADATVALADALGLTRFAVFGMHTGGLIGMQLAWQAPQRVVALLVDGFAAFDAHERAAMGDRYLPPFVSQWDGSHLRWLWCRMREQLFYFPWYDGRSERALTLDPPSIEANHAACMDVLDVGDAYRLGYAAALRYGERHRVAELRCPAWLLYRDEDVLAAHRPRLPSLPAHVRAEAISGGLPALHERIDTVLAEVLASESPARIDPGAGGSGRRRVMVDTRIGELACTLDDAAGQAVVHLHAPGEPPPRRWPIGGPGLQIDLPGHGDSEQACADAGPAAIADAVIELLEALLPQRAVSVVAEGAAATIGLALVRRLGARARDLTLHRPWLLNADEIAILLAGLPDVRLQRTGAHLLEAFQWARERHLLWPWKPAASAARRRVDAPDPARVNAEAVTLLRLGSRLRPMFAGLLEPDLETAVRATSCPVQIHADPIDDCDARVAELALRLKTARMRA